MLLPLTTDRNTTPSEFLIHVNISQNNKYVVHVTLLATNLSCGTAAGPDTTDVVLTYCAKKWKK